jgi:tetratricopeptide (TPR) repeat protein
MDEMLGNHYFLARNYKRAAELLSNALQADPKNKAIRRKLIICYAQIGQIEKGLQIFLSLIKEDIDFVINTDPVDDDCPCTEIVFELEREHANNKDSLDYNLILGMLWLYCHLPKSMEYFQKATIQDPTNKLIKSILLLLENRFTAEKANV